MKFKNLLLLFVFILMIGSVLPIVNAFEFYPLDDQTKLERGNFFFNFKSILGLKTIVNGATCDTEPYMDLTGFTWETIYINCPTTNNNRGCSFDIWRGYYGTYLDQVHIDSGKRIRIDGVDGGRTYETYLCRDITVQCGTERDGGCGGSTYDNSLNKQINCQEGQMLRLRECNPDGISWEATCVPRNECRPEPTCEFASWSSYGVCSDGKECRQRQDNCGNVEVDCRSCGDGETDTDNGNGNGDIIGKSTALTVEQWAYSTDSQKENAVCNVNEDCDRGECIKKGYGEIQSSFTNYIVCSVLSGKLCNLLNLINPAGDVALSIETAENINKRTGTQGYCIANPEALSSTGEQLQRGIDAKDIKSSVAGDLLASSCTNSNQCEDGSTCRPLSFLVDKKVITEDEEKEILDSTKNHLRLAGVGAVTGGVGGALICSAITAIPTAGIGIPLCFGAGAVLGAIGGEAIPDIVQSFQQDKYDRVGYCVTDESFEEIGECAGFIKDVGFLNLSKDECTDGYITLVLVFILLIMLVGVVK